MFCKTFRLLILSGDGDIRKQTAVKHAVQQEALKGTNRAIQKKNSDYATAASRLHSIWYATTYRGYAFAQVCGSSTLITVDEV